MLHSIVRNLFFCGENAAVTYVVPVWTKERHPDVGGHTYLHRVWAFARMRCANKQELLEHSWWVGAWCNHEEHQPLANKAIQCVQFSKDFSPHSHMSPWKPIQRHRSMGLCVRSPTILPLSHTKTHVDVLHSLIQLLKLGHIFNSPADFLFPPT